MESYTNFAYVYDTFMDNVPYDEWCKYLVMLLKQYGVDDGIVLDMGCGTGNMTSRLCQLGYDMIGIDNSEDMLAIAREKAGEDTMDILYLLQDMREFELYGTVRAAVSICDSMNYITNEEDLLQVFKLVNNYLDPKGIFIFDLNTIYKYKHLLGDATIAENREDCSFIWDNYYDRLKKINEYELTLFVQSEDDPDLYRKYHEEHFQKAYTLERIKTMLEDAGMKYLGAFDNYSEKAPMYNSERICVIAQEYGK